MQTSRINSLQVSQCWTPTGRWSPVLTDRRGLRKAFSPPQQCWSSSIQTSCTVSVERHTPSFIPKIPQPCLEDNRFSGFSFDLAAFLPSVPHAAATSALLSKGCCLVFRVGRVTPVSEANTQNQPAQPSSHCLHALPLPGKQLTVSCSKAASPTPTRDSQTI